MHPLILETAARHRRALSTRQRVRIALTVLIAVGAVAAAGVFGADIPTQKKTLSWLTAHTIPLGFAGWAMYAVPLLGLVVLTGPARSAIIRCGGYLLLLPGLAGLAVMSRPRGMPEAEWHTALGAGAADFIPAARLSGYTLLAVFGCWAVFSALRFIAGRPGPIEDTLIKLRRSAFRSTLIALAASPVVVLVFA